ncbi:hypothetical protein DL96DRAFT_1596522 [Flagelloscypha sp. PMI_526]|nr:hypothetical protein DL96DRAFT_1596522 [Flagelloscypha sp. PMI_526]
MRLSLTLLFFSVMTSVVAQVPGLPSCANSCAVQAVSTSGCSSNDTTCLCNSKSFIGATKQCAMHDCAEDDQTTLSTALSNLCNQGLSSAPPDTFSTPGGLTTTSCFDRCIGPPQTGSSTTIEFSTSFVPSTTLTSAPSTSLLSTTTNAAPSTTVSFSASSSSVSTSSPNNADRLQVGFLGTIIVLAYLTG